MRVLIVGHGRMGRFHHKTITEAGDHAITLDPHAPADHTTWSTVPTGIDAAIISVPLAALHEQTLEAIDRGYRTLIEKPGATTPIQARDLQAADPTLAVGYLERGNPATTILDLVFQHAHLTYTRLGPRTTTDIALDVASHDLDLHTLHTQRQQTPTAKLTRHGVTLELDTATIHAGHNPWPIRTIEGDGYTADLITRTIRHPNGNIDRCPLNDLLARQWHEFKQGTPLATITDAVRVIEALDTAGALDLPTRQAA